MKNLKPFFFLFVLVAIASCTISVDGDSSTESVTFYTSDITGRWTQTENSGEAGGTRLTAFELKDDFTAEIEIVDGNGSQTLSGTWELGPEHDSGAFSYLADVSLSFYRDSAMKEVTAFDFKVVGEKKILSVNGVDFEKN